MTVNTTPPLRLRFHGRVLDHLGIQMYQSPVAAIAELVANGWDAEAGRVEISLPPDLDGSPAVTVSDDGLGMTRAECQQRYLNVGYNRRQTLDTDVSPNLHRKLLGRKGIGKFAGFGIARVMRVETVSSKAGERTVFELDIDDLRSDEDEYVSAEGRQIPVLDYDEPDDNRRPQHGTTITLSRLALTRTPSESVFLRSMAIRFLLHQRSDDFDVYVNAKPLPESEEGAQVEFHFPSDYTPGERPDDRNR